MCMDAPRIAAWASSSVMSGLYWGRSFSRRPLKHQGLSSLALQGATRAIMHMLLPQPLAQPSW